MNKTPLKLGPIEVKSGKETPSRLSLLLWGAATCGKTTFAATAPGTKLWISFGDNEHVSVSNRDDVIVANVSDMGYEDLFKHCQSDNPFGLDSFLAVNTHVETVVVDSLTAIEFKALQKAVGEGIGASSGRGHAAAFKPTIENPGISAYGARNSIMLAVMTGFLRVTAKHNVHIIFTSHEGDPHMEDDQKTVAFYAMMLTSKVINNITWRLSEIWFMSQDTHGARERRIAVRPTRKRRPMKSRMFNLKGDPEFIVNYDNEKPDDAPDQMTISKWFDQWYDGGKQRIPVPTTSVKKGK